MENTEMNRSEMHEKIDAKTFLIGAIVGGVVGAATALLLTPKSGKEIRGGIAGQLESVKNKSNQLKTIASEKGTEFISLTKEKSSQLRDMAMDKGTNIAETVKDKSKKLANKVSK